MTRKQLIITIGIVAIVFVGAYFLTRKMEQPQGAYIDRGNRHEAPSSVSYETKKDEQASVTVEVKPLELSPSASQWTFEVVLDTHSVELDDDMAASAFLVDDKGKEYAALAWEGDPPGGHHRKGILKFQSFSQIDVVQLKIRGIGGTERIFEWGIQ